MFKNIDIFVTDETNDFFEDFSSTQKRLKFFTKFKSSDLNYEPLNIEISNPSKKSFNKVKVLMKKDSKNSKTLF